MILLRPGVLWPNSLAKSRPHISSVSQRLERPSSLGLVNIFSGPDTFVIEPHDAGQEYVVAIEVGPSDLKAFLVLPFRIRKLVGVIIVVRASQLDS